MVFATRLTRQDPATWSASQPGADKDGSALMVRASRRPRALMVRAEMTTAAITGARQPRPSGALRSGPTRGQPRNDQPEQPAQTPTMPQCAAAR